ncbi:UDP-glucuronosyltransferase 1A1-like [Alligator mississippiensis]|uniref:UDP-glucuronosyltransferase 1A1-like n=1 Tax=Alligator mississippiensis TaxID=8496 RepID=UPI002877933E|nr:UDP-glucuronosyltransferase 1A1-like [Alligator mississippiensis]
MLLLFLSLLGFAAGGKLLVVPMDGSHWLSMKPVVNELQHRGHEITVVVPEVSMHMGTAESFTIKMYPVPFTKEELERIFVSFVKGIFQEQHFILRVLTINEHLKETSAFFYSTCTHLLYNKELMDFIERSNFDAVFTDPMLPCGQIIALHLSIPSIFFLREVPCGIDSKATQCPAPPSYVPRTLLAYTDHMTFIQRVKNQLLILAESFLCNFVYSPFENLASEFLQRPMTMKELLSHGSIWLKKFDFAFEYARPVMPNMVFIGGINCVQNKPLSQVSDWFVKTH